MTNIENVFVYLTYPCVFVLCGMIPFPFPALPTTLDETNKYSRNFVNKPAQVHVSCSRNIELQQLPPPPQWPRLVARFRNSHFPLSDGLFVTSVVWYLLFPRPICSLLVTLFVQHGTMANYFLTQSRGLDWNWSVGRWVDGEPRLVTSCLATRHQRRRRGDKNPAHADWPHTPNYSISSCG